ncbi:helix-turn-helix domain-containing protein [Streptomyces goshikiensis]|uniref:helix-turn-helix domain-containing protein n=1 Tax=Streptomyces goshikiensis TaxID=1942 RepID=UPI003717DA21
MHDGQSDRNPALTELRDRLRTAMAQPGRSKTALGRNVGLGRTTVQTAVQNGGPLPSERTVVVLARGLGLPVAELVELRRMAAEWADPASVAGGGAGPGRPIGDWDPHDLEVHPAGTAPDSGPGAAPGRVSRRVLPGYVSREHDRVLAEAVREAGNGHGRLVVLVGDSSTGKTRACWEAVQPLAPLGWRLWHPFDPTRAEEALDDLHRVLPRTVVWLNEAQHYFGDPVTGERIAAAVRSLLTVPERGPVLVLGTLWPKYARQYAALPAPDEPDAYSPVRALLEGRTLNVPEAFDAPSLAAAVALAESGDLLLADALTRARASGQLAQDLAGAPQLRDRYEQGSPGARALLQAAMDARRLGVGLHLPHAFLIDAATDYFSQGEYDQRADDWAEAAFAELAHPVHGKQAPLRRAVPRPALRPPGAARSGEAPAEPVGTVFRLADYLEQHGRAVRSHLCPPASFWHAAHTRLTHPEELYRVAEAARACHRLQWHHHLCHRAAHAGHAGALFGLSRSRREAGDRHGADSLLRRAADAGDVDALLHLAEERERAGDTEGAEVLLGRAAASGRPDALLRAGGRRERAGDARGAAILFERAADAGDPDGLLLLGRDRQMAGDLEGAEALYQRVAATSHPLALFQLVFIRGAAGDMEGAEALAQRAADAGHPYALLQLARVVEFDGDVERAEAICRGLAGTGNAYAMLHLADMRERAGDVAGAEALTRQATRTGHPEALLHMARKRRGAGNFQEAEAWAQQAADAGGPDALLYLAEMRTEAGDTQGAETMLRRAADAGHAGKVKNVPGIAAKWRYGLDPDGTPTPPWH